jgi:hypothetical protein
MSSESTSANSPYQDKAAVTASNIQANLPAGNTPMDILNAIMERPSPTANIVQDPRNDIHNAEPNSTPQSFRPVESESSTNTNSGSTDSIPTISKTSDRETVSTTDGLDSQRDSGTGIDSDTGIEEERNLAKLRKAKTETYKELKAKEEELERARKEIEAWEKGEKLSEPLLEKEKRIKELEQYEKLHALKSTKEYREKFIDPINQTTAKLKAVADEYGVPADVINEMLNTKDKRRLNSMIENNFDTLEGLEVKKLVESAQATYEAAKQAELEPARVLEELQHEAYETNRKHMQNLVTKMTDTSKSAWEKAHSKIIADGVAVELIPKEDDSEYNEKVVKPILAKSASEFGKFVTRITGKLKEPLDEEEMLYLANMTQLAHSAAVSQVTRNRAMTTLEEVTKNTQRRNSYLRPSAGGSAPAAPVGGPANTETREARIDDLLARGRSIARRG